MPTTPRRLHGWRDPAVLAATAVSVAAGFAQFGATAALADVANYFGETGGGESIAAQAGLSATVVGIGLGIIRAASLLSLPLAGLADDLGRRRMLLFCCAGGLAFTAAAALSPGYWWFVAIFALGRPLLTATNAVAGVVAAEETRASDRAKALALVAAGYGLGAGLTAIIRGIGGDAVTFRGVFALALVPLAALWLLRRFLHEPIRFAALKQELSGPRRRAVLGRVRADLRPRLAVLACLTFAIAFVTGPINTFLFYYAEGLLGVSPLAMAAVVLAAGPVGLVGLLIGRWAADVLGRRPSAILGQICVASAGMLTYSGTVTAMFAGYLLSVMTAAAYGPPTAALAAELFPTSVRATSAGWLSASGVLGAVAGLVAFGLLGDLAGSLGAAAVGIGVPVLLVSGAFLMLPETRGMELEESAPEHLPTSDLA